MGVNYEQKMWAQLVRTSPDSEMSLQRQIRESLVAAILDGYIGSDTRFPSSRELARQLGVARNTVILAYQHLVDEGYLLARERSGYFVNPEMLPAHRPSPEDSASHGPQKGVAWQERFLVSPCNQRNITKPFDWQQYEYPFIYGQIDANHFPLNDWRECYRQALSVQAVSKLVRDYYDADDPLLVEQIQTRVLPRRGVWASPDEILITLGTQNALYLLASLLVGSDTKVGIEEPGYPDARNIFSMKTDSLKPLPLDDQGLVPGEHLNALDYVFVTPSHQSPTTVTMPLGRRKALLKQAREHDFVVIEDDYESEINFLGSPTPALKSLDEDGRVLYVGSLSKTLDPGVRVGYMVGPPELIREARALRRLMLRHPPANNQHAIGLFLSLGHHDSLIQRLGHAYHERWQAMGDSLAAHLPESSRLPTFGGTSYWVEAPKGVDTRELAGIAAEQGIFLEPGDVNFMTSPPPRNYFRLGFSFISLDRIDPGIQKLSALIHKMTRISS